MIFFLYQSLNEQLAFDLKCKSEHPIFYRILSVYLSILEILTFSEKYHSKNVSIFQGNDSFHKLA
jgi:hypothetical protein